MLVFRYQAVVVVEQSGGCQYYQWEDEMGETSAQAVTPAAPLAHVPLQVVPPAALPTPTPVAVMNEGGQVGGGEVQSNVMQQLRWIEKLMYVAIFLALYAIMKK